MTALGQQFEQRSMNSTYSWSNSQWPTYLNKCLYLAIWALMPMIQIPNAAHFLHTVFHLMNSEHRYTPTFPPKPFGTRITHSLSWNFTPTKVWSRQDNPSSRYHPFEVAHRQMVVYEKPTCTSNCVWSLLCGSVRWASSIEFVALKWQKHVYTCWTH